MHIHMFENCNILMILWNTMLIGYQKIFIFCIHKFSFINMQHQFQILLVFIQISVLQAINEIISIEKQNMNHSVYFMCISNNKLLLIVYHHFFTRRVNFLSLLLLDFHCINRSCFIDTRLELSDVLQFIIQPGHIHMEMGNMSLSQQPRAESKKTNFTKKQIKL